jgi:hypothetical protein
MAIAALLELLPVALAVEEPVALVELVLPVFVPVAAGIEEPAEEAEASACSQMSAAAGATSGNVLDNLNIAEETEVICVGGGLDTRSRNIRDAKQCFGRPRGVEMQREVLMEDEETKELGTYALDRLLSSRS